MAFTSAITEQTIEGNKRITKGTFTSTGGSTGGDIDTGLNVCDSISLQEKAAAVVANRSVVNKTLPAAGNAITIVTDANVVGYWRAEGY